MSDQNKVSIERIIADCLDALCKLEASKREVCSEHSERIRKLRDLVEELRFKRTSGQTELFDVQTGISAELAGYLKDPTHDL